MGLLLLFFQKYLIQLFNLSDPAIIQDAQNYLWITCGFIVFSFVNQIFTGITYGLPVIQKALL